MKKKIIQTSLIMSILLLIIISCNKQEKTTVNIGDEKKLIETTINNCIGWAKNKDIKLLYSIIANDSNYLEVDPEAKVIFGFDELKKEEKFWMDPNFKAIRHDIKDLKINISQSGDVAWWYCVLNDINEWKGKPACWENTRWTGVLEKRANKWIIVQQHFSFASE
jgi:hypothetical protein